MKIFLKMIATAENLQQNREGAPHVFNASSTRPETGNIVL